MAFAAETEHRDVRRPRYRPPTSHRRAPLNELIVAGGRRPPADRQLDLLRTSRDIDVSVYFAGDPAILAAPAVAIVGAREVSHEGKSRAYKLARELAQAQVTVVSGLARGVDTAAHLGAMQSGGRTVAVIGTPLDKAYPAENADLQEQIYSDHLLVSPFAPDERVFRSNFPKRNRVMALLSDATVIVEASDTSGTLHQAAECVKNDRWLFIMRKVATDPALTWPSQFIGKPKVAVLTATEEILEAVAR